MACYLFRFFLLAGSFSNFTCTADRFAYSAMDGEKRDFYPGESSQEKYCDNDSSYGCSLGRNNRIHAEGSSSHAAAQVQAQAPELPEPYHQPGWIFRPNDFEMVKYFLPWKSSNQQIPYAPIQEANIYDCDPFQLLEEYKEHAVDGKDWYFFTTRERKYPNGDRPRRDDGGRGYWRAAGPFHNILDTDKETQIGVKYTLDYYRGKQSDTNADKTNLKMHEYVLETKNNSHAETKKRNEESKDGGNKKKRKKNKPHLDGKETVDEESPKPFHALALCKIYFNTSKNLQEPEDVEANPELPIVNIDTAAGPAGDEDFVDIGEMFLEYGFDPVPQPELNQVMMDEFADSFLILNDPNFTV